MSAWKYYGIIKKSHTTLVAMFTFFAEDLMKHHTDAIFYNQCSIGYQYLWWLVTFVLLRLFKRPKSLGLLELSRINNCSKILKLQSLYKSNLTSKRYLLSSCRSI